MSAGSRKVTLKHIDGSNDLVYFVLRYDAVCSQRTPCLGENKVPWTTFVVSPVGNTNLSTMNTLASYNYPHDTILTIVDTYHATEQYTVSIDGKVMGRTFGPEWMGDAFAGARVFTTDIPAHTFAWGAYW